MLKSYNVLQPPYWIAHFGNYTLVVPPKNRGFFTINNELCLNGITLECFFVAKIVISNFFVSFYYCQKFGLDVRIDCH